MPSLQDLEHNFTAADPDDTGDGNSDSLLDGSEPDVDADADSGCEQGQDQEQGHDPDAELRPGVYKALYDFTPEGTAEMGLREGQLVRVVGRGGGVGWAVVEREQGADADGEGQPVQGECLHASPLR
jgi:hypothetical protein